MTYSIQGRHYRVRFTLDMGNCKMLSVIMWDPITQTYVRMSGTGSALSSGGSYEGTFEAQAARTLFLFEVVPGYGNPVPDSTAYFWIDDFSIEEYTPMYGVTPRNYWSSVKEENGRLKVTGSKPWAEASKMLHLEAGKKYRLRYNADLGNCAYLHIIVANPADGNYVWVPSSGGITTGGNYSGTFTAAADNLEIRFQMPALPTGESTGYFYLDDIYLEEVVEVEDGGSVNGGGYRYQFNGKELDKEVSATTTYDYGFRIYAPALGRFLSVDPFTGSYPWFTPYQYASNSPIYNIDIDGLEGLPAPLKREMEAMEQGWNRTIERIENWFSNKKDGIRDGTKNTFNNILDAHAVLELTQAAILIDPRVATYDEEDKKIQFETNSNSTVAILLFEFAQGTGSAEHTFYWSNYNENSFANKVIEGRVKKEIVDQLYSIIPKDANSYQEHLNSGELYKFGLPFSPDDTKTIGESIEKHLTSNLSQFFIGGANIMVEPIDATSADVTIINYTSRNSLMFHVGENYPIEKEKKKKRTQLSTTRQTIKFRLINLDRERTVGASSDQK